jgi:RNA polymerase-interacting CarD/CdnL/TRCF family regulator
VALNPDFRQRQRDMRTRLKLGTLHDLCEVVRDLSGHSWSKALSGSDAEALRKSSDALAQEWAAAGSHSVAEASAEVSGLLLEGRQAFQV